MLATTRKSKSMDVFLKQPRSKIQHYLPATTKTELPTPFSWLLNLSSRLAHSAGPDLPGRKIQSHLQLWTPPSPTPYSEKGMENRSITLFLAEEQLEVHTWLTTKQAYYSNLPPQVKLSHPLDLWCGRSHWSKVYKSFSSNPFGFHKQSAATVDLNVYLGKGAACNYLFW